MNNQTTKESPNYNPDKYHAGHPKYWEYRLQHPTPASAFHTDESYNDEGITNAINRMSYKGAQNRLKEYLSDGVFVKDEYLEMVGIDGCGIDINESRKDVYLSFEIKTSDEYLRLVESNDNVWWLPSLKDHQKEILKIRGVKEITPYQELLDKRKHAKQRYTRRRY